MAVCCLVTLLFFFCFSFHFLFSFLACCLSLGFFLLSLVLFKFLKKRLFLQSAYITRFSLPQLLLLRSQLRVSMGLTDRRKTAKNLVDSRKN